MPLSSAVAGMLSTFRSTKRKKSVLKIVSGACYSSPFISFKLRGLTLSLSLSHPQHLLRRVFSLLSPATGRKGTKTCVILKDVYGIRYPKYLVHRRRVTTSLRLCVTRPGGTAYFIQEGFFRPLRPLKLGALRLSAAFFRPSPSLFAASFMSAAASFFLGGAYAGCSRSASRS